MTYRCAACDWRKTTAPRSDVLMPGHTHFDRCPKCDNNRLEVTRAGVVDAALGTVGEWLGRAQKTRTLRRSVIVN